MFGCVTKLLPVSVASILTDKDCLLSLVVAVGKSHDSDSLHETTDGVAQELAPWLECSVDANVMFWCHVEIARFRWVVRGLLRDVITPCPVGVVPVASESLTEDRVERLLYSSVFLSVLVDSQHFKQLLTVV